MADDILKSYLVAIGFKLDEQDYKKFKDSQLDTEKRTKNLSKAFSDFAKIGIGSATALGGMVIKVSSDLEKLHFQAQKSGTSAQNLKAFGDAAAQIGMQSEEAMGLVEAFGNKIASGKYVGALNFLGVKQDKDSIKTLLDLVDSLSKANPIVQESFAEQLGISGEDIRTLIRGREELHKYYQERRQVYADIDQQSLAAHKANEEFRDLEARFSALTATVGTSFLPLAKQVVSILEVVVKDLIEADKATDGWSSKLLGLTAAIGGTIGGLKALGMLKGLLGAGGTAGAGSSAAMGVLGAGSLGGILANWGINIKADELDIRAKEGLDSVANENRTEIAMGRLFTKETGLDRLTHGLEYSAWLKNKKGSGGIGHMQLSEGGSSVKGLLDKYAAQYGVDPALIEAQAYQESRFNPKALSPKGAMGVMQLMPNTAKLLGVDPKNTESNIEGGVRMMAGLLRKYHGDTSLALAAYNAGEGAVDRAHGVPRIAETQDYVAAIQRRMVSQAAGNTISVKMDQKTDIHVNGSGDANKTADLVANEQGKVNSGLARDFAGAFQ